MFCFLIVRLIFLNIINPHNINHPKNDSSETALNQKSIKHLHKNTQLIYFKIYL